MGWYVFGCMGFGWGVGCCGLVGLLGCCGSWGRCGLELGGWGFGSELDV